MDDTYKQPEDDIQKWSRLIHGAYNLNNALYIGDAATEVIAAFAQLGVNVSGPQEAAGGEQEPAADALIFQNDAVDTYLLLSSEAFHSRFENPEHILVVFTLPGGEPTLPAVSKWLWGMGYRRDLAGDLWVGDRILACGYNRGQPDAATMFAEYEAEWWRLSQQNQKRRMLLADYHIETVELNFVINERNDRIGHLKDTIASLENVIKEWEFRWDAFQNSRTGRMLNQIQKIRQALPGGRKDEA